MEKQLNFVVMLSLKEFAMRRVVINLWNEPDILASIVNFTSGSFEARDLLERWPDAVESKVTDKITKLLLPKSLSEQMLLIVRPFGLQLQRWKGFHERYLGFPEGMTVSNNTLPTKCLTTSRVEFDATILSKLNWTTSGKIDYRKTAEEILRCEMLDIVKRYKLACLYCLDDYIPLLWEELPEDMQRTFYNEEVPSQIVSSSLPFCWPFILKGELSKLDSALIRNNHVWSFNQKAFIDSACCGNKTAAEYFFRKLTQAEKGSLFLKTTAIFVLATRSSLNHLLTGEFPPENSCDIMSYLLSIVSSEDQLEIIKMFPVGISGCFLDWPSQDLFLKIADHCWAFFNARNYDYLLQKMNEYFRYSNYYYSKFFQVFFTQSPMKFRKMFIDRECRLGDFFPRFFDIQDSETIEVILRNTDAEDREKIVFSEHILQLFYDCIVKDRCHMVRLCLRVAALSKENRNRLKDVFMRFLVTTGKWRIQECEPVWKRFLRLLDEIHGSAQSKRFLNDESVNKAKKLFSDK